MNALSRVSFRPWGASPNWTINWGLLTALGLDVLLWAAILEAGLQLSSKSPF